MGLHPSDELLMSFASGALDEPFALVLNCHLQFCPRCVARVREMEEMGAALLERVPIGDGPADDGFYQRTMQRFLREIGHTAVAKAAHADPGGEFILPKPLERVTGLRRETIPWQDAVPGLQSARVSGIAGRKSGLHFLKMAPGMKLPPETHHGSHLILVLWGAYQTEGGRVTRGDLHEIPAGTAHSFAAEMQEGVTCIAASEASAMVGHSWAI